MKAGTRLLAGLIVGLALVAAVGSTAWDRWHPRPHPTPSAPVAASCHIRGLLPDPVCTPGAVNPAVTQANIGETICFKGWTSTVRPPAAYTDQLKRQGILAYGYADRDPRHYEEDHLVPLELGGHPTDPRNLWPEPGPVPNPKDQVEGRLRVEVCAGRMQLVDAQRAIASDWTRA